MKSFNKEILLTVLIISLGLKGFPAEIRGHVFDNSTKEQLIGAVVTIKSVNKGMVTELDGSFNFNALSPGEYKINVAYLGFESVDTTVKISDNKQVFKLDIYLQPAAKAMNQVVVSAATEGGSDAYANRAEQKSISLMNVVSANAIQISPDITVANVLQRVSGINMDKGTSGESRYVVIRGMEKKYNVTLVNGVKIPSPDDKDRYVPMDIFPAELLERLEVIKTLMPSMEGDATGGTINMVMKSAPSKFTLEASTSAGYSDIFQNRDFEKFDANSVALKSPAEITGPNVGAAPSDFPNKNFMTTDIHSPVNSTGSIIIGNRYLKGKLGVILGGSFQDINRGANVDLLQQNATVPPSSGPNENNIQPFSDILVRQYSFREERIGTESKIDYIINDRNSLDLFLTYAQLNEYRVRNTVDSQLGGYTLHNYVGPVSISDELQTRQTRQGIYNITLQGKHTIVSSLKADWSLVASQATQKMPDIAAYSVSQDAVPNVAAQTLSLTPPVLGSESREWEHNTDKDLDAYVNFHYFSHLIPGLTNIDFGGLVRHKDRDNYDNQYKLKSTSDSTFTSLTPSSFYFGSTNSNLGNGYESAGTYTFTENISAYYVQLHDEIGARIKLDGGIRVESTDQSYVSTLPVTFPGKSATISYSDFLPSAQFKYELNTKSAIRLDYYRSIYRPAFADLIPFLDYNSNETYPTMGNPNLQHTIIDNFDMRYELFPKGLDQLLVGVFYKYLTDPIEYGIGEIGRSAGEELLAQNVAANAQNAGVELACRKFFGNFGVAGNYTYTNSDASSPQLRYWANAASGTHYDTINTHRALQGQAANIGNLSLLYKDSKRKIESQLAVVYTGERIYALAAYVGLNNWEKATTNLDFSVQKGIDKHFTVYFKANNLLNTPFELFIKQQSTVFNSTTRLPFQESASYVTVEKDLYYRTFLLGVRYKF